MEGNTRSEQLNTQGQSQVPREKVCRACQSRTAALRPGLLHGTWGHFQTVPLLALQALPHETGSWAISVPALQLLPNQGHWEPAPGTGSLRNKDLRRPRKVTGSALTRALALLAEAAGSTRLGGGRETSPRLSGLQGSVPVSRGPPASCPRESLPTPSLGRGQKKSRSTSPSRRASCGDTPGKDGAWGVYDDGNKPQEAPECTSPWAGRPQQRPAALRKERTGAGMAAVSAGTTWNREMSKPRRSYHRSPPPWGTPDPSILRNPPWKAQVQVWASPLPPTLGKYSEEDLQDGSRPRSKTGDILYVPTRQK